MQRQHRTRRLSGFWVFLLVVIGFTGCMVPRAKYDKVLQERISADTEIEKLKETNKQHVLALAEKDKQISALQSLGPERLERLFHVERIELGKHTGGGDLDNKPGDDAIRVYLTPIDQAGSTIKAAGSVNIQLFDLAADEKENVIGRYEWTVEKSAEHWKSFLMHHYSFTCPWGDAPPKHDEITVRVEFTDYLTGKVLTKQTVCKVRLPVKPTK